MLAKRINAALSTLRGGKPAVLLIDDSLLAVSVRFDEHGELVHSLAIAGNHFHDFHALLATPAIENPATDLIDGFIVQDLGRLNPNTPTDFYVDCNTPYTISLVDGDRPLCSLPQA